MQGIHCTSDAPYVPMRLGDKRAEEGAYVWQKLMKSGALVTNGTDAPVEDVDPIASYYATVSRKMKGGGVFYPEQRMNRMEALRSYTINTARSAFEEDSKGTLKVGKYADIVVLSKDISDRARGGDSDCAGDVHRRRREGPLQALSDCLNASPPRPQRTQSILGFRK